MNTVQIISRAFGLLSQLNAAYEFTNTDQKDLEQVLALCWWWLEHNAKPSAEVSWEPSTELPENAIGVVYDDKGSER